MVISTLEPAHSTAVLPVDANRVPEESQTTLPPHQQQSTSSLIKIIWQVIRSQLTRFAERASQRTAVSTGFWALRKKSVVINT